MAAPSHTMQQLTLTVTPSMPAPSSARPPAPAAPYQTYAATASGARASPKEQLLISTVFSAVCFALVLACITSPTVTLSPTTDLGLVSFTERFPIGIEVGTLPLLVSVTYTNNLAFLSQSSSTVLQALVPSFTAARNGGGAAAAFLVLALLFHLLSRACLESLSLPPSPY